jgi:GT2 family glycosyltransferase
MKSVWIIIVNYRTPELVIDCLRSLAEEMRLASEDHPCNWRVVVVENASGDGSAEKIGQAMQTENWATWAQLVPLD